MRPTARAAVPGARRGARSRFAGGLLAGLCLLMTVQSGVAECLPRLLVTPADAPDTKLAELALGDGHFALGFMHSVSRTPVVDEYRVQDGAIRQRAQHFAAHGPGMTATPAEVGDAGGWTMDEAGMRIELDRPIEELVIRVDPDYGNHVVAGGVRVDLTRWGRARLRLSVNPCLAD